MNNEEKSYVYIVLEDGRPMVVCATWDKALICFKDLVETSKITHSDIFDKSGICYNPNYEVDEYIWKTTGCASWRWANKQNYYDDSFETVIMKWEVL